MFIDSHCHLIFEDFQTDLDDVLRRAEDVGVDKIIVPALDLTSSQATINLVEKYPQVYAAVGVHPQDSQKFMRAQLEDFYQLAEHPKVVAIGEIGLDYFRDYAPRYVQRTVFETFMNVAKNSNLPVIIHNRAAFYDLLQIVKKPEFNGVRGVFHCFSEDEKVAADLFEKDYVVSFTGTITFKKSKSAEVAQQLPIEKQLLETDAPFMAPVPNRGKRNEPAFVKWIAEKQAEMHGISPETVGKITSDLANQFFLKLQN